MMEEKQPGLRARLINAQAGGTERDVERDSDGSDNFFNDTIQVLSWQNIEVTVKDRSSGAPKKIITSATGHVKAGEVLGLMGPSGCGKTTLLNALAHRLNTSKTNLTGTIEIDGRKTTASKLSAVARYVEQDDALIGSLTVRESIEFGARLALPSTVSKVERKRRVDEALRSFGIDAIQSSIVGTPLKKGISGGQKRRLSVASQLVTSPKILFLDEPTSGLDSAASKEVMGYISRLAKKLNLLVIVSIHQPATSTFNLLDQVLLLSAGRTCYFGPRGNVEAYFSNIGHPVPTYENPAEFLLDLVNIDFAPDKDVAHAHLNTICEKWTAYAAANESPVSAKSTDEKVLSSNIVTPGPLSQTLTLLHRSAIKSYRDVIAYQLRIAMYTALAIMMGTVWLRLPYEQTSIAAFTTAIFFSGAFMSFMAVAYIPAYVEDLQMFRKERANGLYGPLPFMLANFLIGLPYLFLITLLFSVIAYWLVNLRPTAGGFWLWVVYLFLDLLAAEGLVVLIASILPIFVVALAVTAFANGLWMCVGGFLVQPGTLNVFWKYVFHYIDYQAWVTQGLIINQFKNTEYACASNGHGGYNCMYPSDLMPEGKIRGTAVIEAYKYGYNNGEHGRILGIMIGIIFAYRLLGYAALVLRR